MTRAHAARMLLALGPLSFRDFHAITGWPREECRRVLTRLQQRRVIRSDWQHGRRTVWRLR